MRLTFLSLACAVLMAAVVPAMAAGVQRVPPTRAEAAAVRAQGRYLATITLENGKKIEIVLEGADAPYTVANFIKLAKTRFYEGVPFHRVDEQAQPRISLVQGGDPEGTGKGGPGYKLNLEIAPFLTHKKGAISMLRIDRSLCSGSQFLILKEDLPLLDGQYAPFGWVKSGMDVLAAVKPGDKMKTVVIAQYAGKETCPLEAVYTPPRPAPTKAEIDATAKQGRYLASITMASGKKIDLVLEGKLAPQTVANFVKLINSKYYNGLTFHRVEQNEGFQLIQGGDPNGDGSGGPGYEIPLEIVRGLSHKTGALSMARSEDPDSAGSQFYITYCDIPQLDGNYAVFGWVKNGLDVVKEVQEGDTMKTVTVRTYAGTEACPLVVKEEAPAVEVPKEEAPAVEAPKVESPKEEAPKAEAPKAEEKTEEAK